jgi:parallel beta-helix repeat protein
MSGWRWLRRRAGAAALCCAAMVPVAAAAAVRYVDPANPAARDAGEGAAGRPYRTLTHAMKGLKPGDTLNIGAGVYREAIVFPAIDWAGPPTVIQPAAGAEVLIKGSDVVSGWERGDDGVFVRRGWSVPSQQVFVDGRPLEQTGGTIFNGFPDRADHRMRMLHAGQGGIWPGRVAGGVREMKDESFYYDAAAQTLYVKVAGATLDGRLVEASVRPFLVSGRKLQNVTLKGLKLRHSNTTAVNQQGAVTLEGNRLTLEGLDVAHADGAGFDITGDANVIQGNRASYCGQLGMKVRGRANRVTGNEWSFNNTRGFNKWWEAGGAKFVGDGGLRDSEVSGNRAIGNNGDGIWFDWMNADNRIHDNVAAYNSGFGIHYEASQRGYIHDNYVFGNRQRGIYLPHSAESVVAHNLVAGNGMEGVAIVDEGRSRTRPELVPRANRVVGNIFAWNGKAAVVLPAGALDSVSNYNLFLSGPEPPTFSMGWSSKESPLRRGLDAWKAASGQDASSWTEPLDMPAEIREAMQARKTIPRWEGVLASAARFRVRVAGPGGPLPGVVDSAPPGPRRGSGGAPAR